MQEQALFCDYCVEVLLSTLMHTAFKYVNMFTNTSQLLAWLVYLPTSFGIWYLPRAMLKSNDPTPVIIKGCSLCTICQHNNLFAL